jgi:hypothetical protein
VSQRSLQNSLLESSCVIVALIENYSTSKPLKVSPEKSQILSYDTLVTNKRYIYTHTHTQHFFNLASDNLALEITPKTRCFANCNLLHMYRFHAFILAYLDVMSLSQTFSPSRRL